MSKPPRPPVSLDEFLTELDAVMAGEARAAAERMDALERTVDDVRDIESRYWWLVAIAALAFVCGAVIVLYPSPTTEAIFNAIGRLGVAALTCGLGVLGLIYGFVVRRRSAVDEVLQQLNRTHFVPHNAYYFPPETPEEAGRVVFFTPRKLKPMIAGPHDNVRPGSSWW